MLRRTKIVATIGPASSSPKVLERMIKAGVNVVRMNFSHGAADEHLKRVELARQIARSCDRTVGVIADLQGPKIRIGKFAQGKTRLVVGSRFVLDANVEFGDHERVGLDYKDLPNDVAPGDTLLLNDGLIVLKVDEVSGGQIICKVRQGGTLSDNKGINRKGGGLSAPALTEKDLDDIKVAAQMEADYLAVSFVRSGGDIERARKLLRKAGGKGLMMAKIERAEAITALDEILEATDAIMVARGDLSVEVGDAAVPALQKRMIRTGRARNKVVVTATQMMESMIQSPIPTRAEVSDVANAVLDGTDAVMLSAESAVGYYPVEAVEAMNRVCIEAEIEGDAQLDRRGFMNQSHTRIDQSIAMAASFSAYHLKAKAIGALTQSGSTTLWMSRMHAGVPIYALTPVQETWRKVTLYGGVHAIRFNTASLDRDEVLMQAEEELLRRGAVKHGDLIVLTIGEAIGQAGHTNTMKIVRVGQHDSE
ncbi:MAG: pyruvate kinase [Burkholderiales bacterium]|nr:pyruvate kinase [Burkholderiales bacterium]MDQ3195223.1 pyruvate kinase [Pseudomonadota bacterium]